MCAGGAGRTAGTARATAATTTHAGRRAVVAMAAAATANCGGNRSGGDDARANGSNRTDGDTTGSSAAGASGTRCRSGCRSRRRGLGKRLTDQAGHEDYCKQLLHVNTPV